MTTLDTDELTRRLMLCIGNNESYKMKRRTKNQNVSMIKQLRRREFGKTTIPVVFQRNTMKYLVCDPNRYYIVSETYDFQGYGDVERGLLFSRREQTVVDLGIARILYRLDVLDEFEVVYGTLFVEQPVDLSQCSSSNSPYWIILLTNHGKLLIVDLHHGTLEAQFRLPADKFRFRSILWNVVGRSFYVVGLSLTNGSHINVLHRTTSRSVFVAAFFDVCPLHFKGMFILPKEVFGSISSVNVISDAVVIFKKRPCAVVVYSLLDIMRESTQRTYCVCEGSSGDIVLECSVDIDKEPPIYLQINGAWNIVEFSGHPYHLLVVPSSSRGRHLLSNVKNLYEPIKTPFDLSAVNESCFMFETTPLTFHPDESGRILHFEASHIVCYSLQNGSSQHAELVVQWRTQLWAGDDFIKQRSTCNGEIKSRYGRTIRATDRVNMPNYAMIIKDVDFDSDCQFIVVSTQCDLRSPVFDDPQSPYDTMARLNVYSEESEICNIVFLLDDMSGKIMKIAIMRSPVRERATQNFQMDGTVLSFIQRSSARTLVEVQRLEEKGVKEWNPDERKNELIRVRYTSAALNRRQRRLQRRALQISTRNMGRNRLSESSCNERTHDKHSNIRLPSTTNYQGREERGSRLADSRGIGQREFRRSVVSDDGSTDSDYIPSRRVVISETSSDNSE